MEINVPKPFNPNKNQIAKDWQIWKTEFLIYLKLSKGYQTLTEEKRAFLLLNLMGTKAFEAIRNIKFDNPKDLEDMDILLLEFDKIFDPPSNLVEDRFKFFSRIKREDETIEKYVMDLKEKAQKCRFGEHIEKFIIDMIIRNMDTYLRQMTFKEKEIKLGSIIESYKQYDINTKKIKELSENIAKDFNSERKDDTDNTNNNPNKSKKKHKVCWMCNTRHQQRCCPAHGNVCRVCNERNHFNGLCRKNNNSEEQLKRICLKCNKNHYDKECPAYFNVCQKCKTTGHYIYQCDKLKAMENTKIATNNQIDKSSFYELPKKSLPSYAEATGPNNNAHSIPHLEDCVWCGSKHLIGQCAHNWNCSYCTQFPHKVCFNCKPIPHLDNCYLKMTMLPKTTVKPNVSEYCHSCKNNPKAFCLDCKHRTVNPEYLKRNTNSFVSIEHSDIPKSTQFQPRRSPSPKRNPPSRNDDNKKKKNDNCCIS